METSGDRFIGNELFRTKNKIEIRLMAHTIVNPINYEHITSTPIVITESNNNIHKNSLNASLSTYFNYKPTGLIKDTKLSDRRSKVYTDDDKNVYIAYRGTRFNNFNDLIADAHIWTGTEKYSSRFQESENKFNKVKSKYPDSNVILTGHSLGGQQAKYVGSKNKAKEVITYNAFSNPKNDLLRINQKNKTKTTNYRTYYDYASFGELIPSKNSKTINIGQRMIDPHTIHNFENTSLY